jgi:hypothetical protein
MLLWVNKFYGKYMVTIKDITEKAKKELASLTGFANPAGVGIRQAGTGWTVAVEVVEKKSIPDGMDLIGLYEVEMDATGSVTSYARKGLRKRGDTQGVGSEE